MAGYFISTLDASKFQQFVESPTESQLLAVGELVSDELDEFDDQFSDDDPVADWPSEPSELVPILRQRLLLPDWYGDLSQTAREFWELVVRAIPDVLEKELDCQADLDDEIYWDVIELARKHYSTPGDVVTEAAFTRFGTTPFRYHPVLNKPLAFEDWRPMHSVHTPEEVKQMIEEFEAIEPEIQKSAEQHVEQDYERLMSVLDSAAKKTRILWVQVDT